MWTTRVTVVDIETGEVITSPREIENYIIDKKLTQKIYEYGKERNIAKITKFGKRDR